MNLGVAQTMTALIQATEFAFNDPSDVSDTFITTLKLYFPRDILTKIYIWWWRLYWRKYVPLSAKVPTWYDRHIKIQKLHWEARAKNIHALHLPFNTLLQNKKWIPGCQCETCKDYEGEDKAITLMRCAICPDHFENRMPSQDITCYYDFIVNYDMGNSDSDDSGEDEIDPENVTVTVHNRAGLVGNYWYDPLWGSRYEQPRRRASHDPTISVSFSDDF